MKESLKKIYAKLSSLCSTREMSVYDVRNQLSKSDVYSEEDISEIIDLLKQESFIDEARYARNFAHDKLLFNKWGPRKIRYELSKKQLDGTIIEKAIRDIPSETLDSVLSDVIEKKKKILTKKNPFSDKQRIIRYAVGKGFDFSDIEKMIEKD